MTREDQRITDLTVSLEAIDYDALPISEYNKRYIRSLKPVFPYFMKIYSFCTKEGLSKIGKPIEDVVLVDYGGGSGFFSIYAKAMGFKKVIYIDLNPNSCNTVALLKETLGVGPDVILNGDVDALLHWSKENDIVPDLLVATDLIEHIYNLETFFSNLSLLNPNMQMVFTTASNPYNRMKNRNLKRIMKMAETGDGAEKGFYQLRRDFIKAEYPEMKDVDTWAAKTRGLTYPDIKTAIDLGAFPTVSDSYNTCDPENGNWTERILPIRRYKAIVAPLGYSVEVKKGFYCTCNGSFSKQLFSMLLNLIIRLSGKLGFCIAPFILMKYHN